MRLINVETLETTEFFEDDVPEYAILSHRWRSGEVNLKEFQKPEKRPPAHDTGYEKILACCKLAWTRGVRWVWIDTVCIDKKSSAELSEAINSMFRYYSEAKECYAYLHDVSSHEDDPQRLIQSFRSSSWFSRGWTLQELIAPSCVLFFAGDWTLIGVKEGSLSSTSGSLRKGKIVSTKRSARQDVTSANLTSVKEMVTELCYITGIPIDVLENTRAIQEKSVAQKMSWAAKRRTTRTEDEAYCLLGLLGVNMPLLYGEGKKAFQRLQLELLRSTSDESIFAWHSNAGVRHCDIMSRRLLLLAHSPSSFANASEIVPRRLVDRKPYSVTNQGLELKISGMSGAYYTREGDSNLVITLNCAPSESGLSVRPCFLQLQLWGCGHWVVVKYEVKVDILDFAIPKDWREVTDDTTIYIHFERPSGRDPVCGTDERGHRRIITRAPQTCPMQPD